MKARRCLGVSCLGILLLPLLLVEAQDAVDKTKKRPAGAYLPDVTRRWRDDYRDTTDVEARRNAVEGYNDLANELGDAVNCFTWLLRDEDDDIRLKAVEGLKRIGPSAGRLGAVRPLTVVVENDKVPKIRMEAVVAIGNILWYGCNPNEAEYAVPVLVKAMRKDPESDVRVVACRTLRMIGPTAKDAAPALLEVIKNNDVPQICEYAWHSLSAVVSPQSKAIVPALLQMYENEKHDWLAKTFLLSALGKIGDKKEVVVQIVIGVLKDPKQKPLRAGAVQAARYLGPSASETVPYLIELLIAKDFPNAHAEYGIRTSVLSTLETMGPSARTAIPALKRLVDDRLYQGQARRALKAISPN